MAEDTIYILYVTRVQSPVIDVPDRYGGGWPERTEMLVTPTDAVDRPDDEERRRQSDKFDDGGGGCDGGGDVGDGGGDGSGGGGGAGKKHRKRRNRRNRQRQQTEDGHVAGVESYTPPIE